METMTTLLESFGSVFTALFGYVETVFDFVIANPLALIFLGLGFASTVVGFAMRLIRSR